MVHERGAGRLPYIGYRRRVPPPDDRSGRVRGRVTVTTFGNRYFYIFR